MPRRASSRRFYYATSFDQCLGWRTSASGADTPNVYFGAYANTKCMQYQCGVNMACPLTDGTIRAAVADWLLDGQARADVEAKYGLIENWLTHEITDMSELRYAASF